MSRAATLNYDGQELFGISANVGDNDEPFIALRPTDGSTIITEGGMPDAFDVVLTFMPTRDIDVFIFAPLPTPSSRERGAQMFLVNSDTAVAPNEEPTIGGTSIMLRFTESNWHIPQTVNVAAGTEMTSDGAGSNATRLEDTTAAFQTDGVQIDDLIKNTAEDAVVKVTAVVSETELDTEAVTDWSDDTYEFAFEDRSPPFLPISTRPEIADSTDGFPPRDFVYDDDAFEGVRFGVVNISVKASITQDAGAVVDLNMDRDVITINSADLDDFDTTTIIGQNLQIESGDAEGQNRFVTGITSINAGMQFELNLDRQYVEEEFPNTESNWLIQDDDSLLGLMDDPTSLAFRFREHAAN